MRNVIVTGVARAAPAVVDQLAELGVATVHEAIGRAGYLKVGCRIHWFLCGGDAACGDGGAGGA